MLPISNLSVFLNLAQEDLHSINERPDRIQCLFESHIQTIWKVKVKVTVVQVLVFLSKGKSALCNT